MVCRNHQEQQEYKFRNRKIKRYAVIGLATIGGGALLGLTGGFAAPLIGAGLGSFIGAGKQPFLINLVGVCL